VGGTGYYFGGRSASATGVQCIRESIQGVFGPGSRKADGATRHIYGQSEVCNLSLVVVGWKVWHKIDWHVIVAGLPPEDLSANARATGVVLAVEQSSNSDKGDACGKHYSGPCRIKKATACERPPSRRHSWMHPPVQYTVLAEIPATNPADAHSAKKFGLHQPRPSPDPPSSVTSCFTAATTPRPSLGDLYDQDPVVGSDGFDGTNDEGDSDCLGYYPPPLPSGVMPWGSLALAV
jgi:hypothetical protein